MFIIKLLGIVAIVAVAIVYNVGLSSKVLDESVKGKKSSVSFIAAAVSVILFLLASNMVKVVPTGHTGVISVLGKIEDRTLEAGVHVLPNPFSKVINIDNRTQKATIELSAFSSDIQEVSVVYTINYCLDKTNAQKLYKEIGLNYFDVVIQPKVVENVKSVMAKYNAENLVSSRNEVAIAIENDLIRDLTKYNIQVVATSIENLDFTDAFTNAVEAKQVAEQNKLKTKTEAETAVIKAQAEANVKLIEAKATAEANELLTESLTEEILKKQAIERWDGKMPTVISDNSNILDLTGLTD